MTTTVSWFVPERNGGWVPNPFDTSPAWHPSKANGSVWIRAYQTAPYLEAKGYEVLCNEPSPPPDVAIFQYRHENADIELAKGLQDQGTRIVVDVPSHYFEPRDSAHGYTDAEGVGAVSEDEVARLRRLIDVADQVWTVSPFLQDVVAEFHDDVRFLAESVDPTHFKSTSLQSYTDDIVLGWSGYSVKAKHLSMIEDLIIDNDVTMRIISDEPPDIAVPFQFAEWDYETFPEQISRCDLCVAPRTIEDEYNKSHSLFKIGVFMSLGVPTLASPVPSYELLLGDGRGGALCRSHDQWETHMTRFFSDPVLRNRWTLEAREAMQPYMTPRVAERMDSLIQNL